MTESNSDLVDRVPYCVVKPNCPGPSIIDEEYTKLDGPKWVCRHCGGYVKTVGKMPLVPPVSRYGR